MKVGIYARVSTNDQKTLPMQIQAINEYVKLRGWNVTLTVEEISSGVKKLPKRELIISAAKRREIDVVIVWKLDRWGRSVTDLFMSLNELNAVDVSFISITEAIDLTTPMGRAMTGLLTIFADFERELLRERVKAGIAHAREQGKPHGRPATAKALTDKIIKLNGDGLNKSEISRQLNIARSSVRRILEDSVNQKNICKADIEKLRKVNLVTFDSNWVSSFNIEATCMKTILGNNLSKIHHIGSTAIPGIFAKPIIDILLVVQDISTIDVLNSEFEKLGYICMGEYGIQGRRFYWKSKNKRTHHVHLFEKSNSEIKRHLEFKNYLITHKDFAAAYSTIKQCLANVFQNDIVNYIKGKNSFIQMIDYKSGVAKNEQLQAVDGISIQEYDAAWEGLAKAEISAIKKICSLLKYQDIQHVGSTAVPELSSKPVLDIFISINSMSSANEWVAPLESMGYVFWKENPDKSHHRFFKGMPPFGTQRTHHVHIISKNNNRLEHSVFFRDLLRNNKKLKSAYQTLKICLSEQYPDDREAYTDGKGNFIKQVLLDNGYEKEVER